VSVKDLELMSELTGKQPSETITGTERYLESLKLNQPVFDLRSNVSQRSANPFTFKGTSYYRSNKANEDIETQFLTKPGEVQRLEQQKINVSIVNNLAATNVAVDSALKDSSITENSIVTVLIPTQIQEVTPTPKISETPIASGYPFNLSKGVSLPFTLPWGAGGSGDSQRRIARIGGRYFKLQHKIPLPRQLYGQVLGKRRNNVLSQVGRSKVKSNRKKRRRKK
jgi:hypothetical protein